MEKVMKIKQEILTTPVADATEVEKGLFEIDLTILGRYINGQIEDDMLEHFSKQLKRMPVHNNHSNI